MTGIFIELFTTLVDVVIGTGTKSSVGLSSGVIAILASLIGATSGIGGQLLSNYLTGAKERRMFVVTSVKEDDRYFSKLYGNIVSGGYSLKIKTLSLSQLTQNLIYYDSIGPKEEAEEAANDRHQMLFECRNHKAEFLKLLGEYNYYHKDVALDSLMQKFSMYKADDFELNTPPIKDHAELISKRDKAEARLEKEYNPLIDEIIKHLVKLK
jgi:hypothetical protein